MRLRRWTKYGIGAGGMLVFILAILLGTGWGTAVAAQISNVFVTNTSSNPVPVQAVAPAHSFSVVVGNGDTVPIDGCGDNLPAGTTWFISSFGGENHDDGALDSFGTLNVGTFPAVDVLGPALYMKPQDTAQLTFPQPFVLTSRTAGECLFFDSSHTLTRHVVVGYRQ